MNYFLAECHLLKVGGLFFPFKCRGTALNDAQTEVVPLGGSPVGLEYTVGLIVYNVTLSQPPSTLLTSTHQTSSDVLDGLLDVHAWPVVQHVTDTGCAVDKPYIIFTSFWHCVETGSERTDRRRKPRGPEGYTTCWKWAQLLYSELMSVPIKCASVPMTSGVFESE